MEKERIVGAGILHKPMHGPEDVLLGGLAHWVLLVVCKNNHVLPLVAKVVDEV